MGPGILTRYSKQVLGGILAVFAILAAVLLLILSAIAVELIAKSARQTKAALV